jgi:hypothetical protein
MVDLQVMQELRLNDNYYDYQLVDFILVFY